MKVDVDVVILMGVSGCGKTTVGRGWRGVGGRHFLMRTIFHPRAKRGEDGAWRAAGRCRPVAVAGAAAGGGVGPGGRADGISVFGTEGGAPCPADGRGGCRAGVVGLFEGGSETIRKRMDARDGHYMKSGLLESQFEALEEPEGVMVCGHRAARWSPLVDAVVAVL